MAGRSSTARWPRLPRNSPPRPGTPASKRFSSAPPVTRIRGKDDCPDELRTSIPPVPLDQEPDRDAHQAAEAAEIPPWRRRGRTLLLLVFLPHALRDARQRARLRALRFARPSGALRIHRRVDSARHRLAGLDHPPPTRGAELHRSRGRLPLSGADQPPHADPFQAIALPNRHSVHDPAADARDQTAGRTSLDSRRGLVADPLHVESSFARVLLRPHKAAGSWHQRLAAASGYSCTRARPGRYSVCLEPADNARFGPLPIRQLASRPGLPSTSPDLRPRSLLAISAAGGDSSFPGGQRRRLLCRSRASPPADAAALRVGGAV